MFIHVKSNNPVPEIKQVTVDGVRYYSTPEGNILLPSVTTVLSKADPKKNKALERWKKNKGEAKANEIKNVSAVRGKGLHKVIEDYLNNKPLESMVMMPNVRELFNSMRSTLDEKINNIYYQETPLYSHKLGLAGTVDCCAEYEGIPSIIDFKNAKSLRKEEMVWTYFLQETAYLLMLNEWMSIPFVKQIVTIMGVENERNPQIFIKKPEEYIGPLLKAVKLYNDQNPK